MWLELYKKLFYKKIEFCNTKLFEYEFFKMLKVQNKINENLDLKIKIQHL
jgi:hypothetical protein